MSVSTCFKKSYISFVKRGDTILVIVATCKVELNSILEKT